MSGPRRGERGTSLIEVMIAGVVLLVAMIGFVATMNDAAHATSVGHRRTVATQVRSELLETVLLTPRDRLVARPAAAWIVDSCYDVNAQRLAQNTAFVSPYDCPNGTMYRSWIRYDPQANLTLAVHAYVERLDPGCDVTQRYQSLACTAADVFVSD